MAYDIVVVGAGPAGAVSARFAAESGARTLIIDRKREIGRPVRCAEVVANTLPGNFGMKKNTRWLENEAHHFGFVSPSGRRVRIRTSPYSGYVLDRAEFEKELLEMAVDSGADVILGKTVTDLTKQGIVTGSDLIRTKIVIAADGVDSRIARKAGIKTKSKAGQLGSCAQHTLVNVKVDSDCLEFYLGSTYAPGGYAWVFPKSSEEVNVGVGIVEPKPGGAASALAKFVATQFPKGQSIRFLSGCVPSVLPPAECVKGNVVAVGDAARQVNPFTGAGIANAFIAGKLAGEICGNTVAKELPLTALKRYDRVWRAALEKKLKKSLRLKERLLLNDKKIERFCLFLNLIPGFIIRRLAKNLHY